MKILCNNFSLDVPSGGGLISPGIGIGNKGGGGINGRFIGGGPMNGGRNGGGGKPIIGEPGVSK